MSYRNRRLLNLAHEAPCFARFRHECTQWRGCEPSHADSQVYGRGHGHKSPDWCVAFMCHNAHAMISARINPPFDREQKFTEWQLAHVATMNWLFDNEKLKLA